MREVIGYTALAFIVVPAATAVIWLQWWIVRVAFNATKSEWQAGDKGLARFFLGIEIFILLLITVDWGLS